MKATSFRIPLKAIMSLSESDAPEWIQIARVGTFSHPDYGTFTIDNATLASMKKNFDEGTRGVDLALDYSHENLDEAAAWFKALDLRADGKELWAQMLWTPKGKDVVASKEFRYISPEFTFNYEDNEPDQTGKKKSFGPTLLGAGLTNRPCIKNMNPVVQLTEIKCDEMDSCVKQWIPELISKGHDQEQAVAIAYSKCRKELGLSLDAGSEREKLHQEQASRSKKYGIEVASDGALTPPAGQPTEESLYADPVNFKYPMPDKAQTANARVRFKQNAGSYKQDSSKAVVHNRIVKRELELGITPDFDPKDPLDAMLSPDLKSKLQKPTKETKKMDIKYDLTPDQLKSMSPDDLVALVQQCLAKMKEMEGGMATMQAEKKMAEKKQTFAKLLSEGKVCVAQEQAFLEGDILKMAELSEKVKLDTAGKNDNDDQPVDAETEIKKLAEEKLTKGEVKTYHEGMSKVLKENPELEKKLNEKK